MKRSSVGSCNQLEQSFPEPIGHYLLTTTLFGYNSHVIKFVLMMCTKQR